MSNNAFSFGNNDYAAYQLVPDLKNPSKADLIMAFAENGFVRFHAAPLYASENGFMLGSNHIVLMVQITGLYRNEDTGELQYKGLLDDPNEGLHFHVFGTYDTINRCGTISSLDKRFDPCAGNRVRGENAVADSVDASSDSDMAKFDQELRSKYPDV